MKTDFIQDLHSSFAIWFDHTLLQEGEAFTNVSGSLYPTTSQSLPNYKILGSTYKQWVYDSSVSGVSVPSSVSINGNTLNRGQSGISFDFQNGRVISPSLNATNITGATCNYSAKDFNIYTTNSSDYELIFENRYMINPTYPQVATGVPEDKLIAPCIFLKIKQFSNKPFTFGGNDMTTVNMRAVIISDDEFKLRGVGNIFVDRKNTYMPIITGTPINRLGDIKNGSYNYTDIVASQLSNNLAYISECVYTRFSQASVAEKQPNMHLGFLDFNLEISRWPRA